MSTRERANYITLLWKFRGHPENDSFMQFSQRIDGFRQKRFTMLLEITQLYKQNPLEQILNFTIYQNYTLTLSSSQCGGAVVYM